MFIFFTGKLKQIIKLNKKYFTDFYCLCKLRRFGNHKIKKVHKTVVQTHCKISLDVYECNLLIIQ